MCTDCPSPLRSSGRNVLWGTGAEVCSFLLLTCQAGHCHPFLGLLVPASRRNGVLLVSVCLEPSCVFTLLLQGLCKPL